MANPADDNQAEAPGPVGSDAASSPENAAEMAMPTPPGSTAEPNLAPHQQERSPSASEESAARADVPPPVLPELPPQVQGTATAPAAPVAHPLVFHGKTEEYFRIWIVNTLLTLLTVGVFFAWAKVRKRRYLRGTTELMGHRFDYRARPVRLLIGHIVVVILFLGYSVFGVVYPVIRYSVLGLGVVLLPWIVVRSFTFNAHNTVYRGLRFRFNTSLSAAVQVYLLEPLLIGLTLGIYYPAWQRAKRAYAVENHRFGDAYFRFRAPAGMFYAAYIAGAGIVIGAVVIGSIATFAIVQKGGKPTDLVQLLPFFLVYGFGFYLARTLIYGMLFNHVWNNTKLDDHQFRADLDVGRWVGLQLTNLFAILFSLGLLYPWAVIRAQRYAASCLALRPAGSIDTIQSLGGAGGSATGDMAAEFIGIDFGL